MNKDIKISETQLLTKNLVKPIHFLDFCLRSIPQEAFKISKINLNLVRYRKQCLLETVR